MFAGRHNGVDERLGARQILQTLGVLRAAATLVRGMLWQTLAKLLIALADVCKNMGQAVKKAL